MSGRARRAGMQGALQLVRLAAASTLMIAAALLVPAATLADTSTVVTDCAPPLPIEKAAASADLVFVGSVSAVGNEGRSATVDVSEVWRGDVPATVLVNGGADPTNLAEDDRTFTVGTTYLFIPPDLSGLAGGVVIDNVCSSTVPWTADLAAFRPSNVGTPRPLAGERPALFAFLGSFAGVFAMVGLVGGGALVIALLVSQRQQS